jgi:5-methylcytosine-specific restriction endonuclease McrA
VPWDNSPAKRARDAAVYRDPEYLANRTIVLWRADGRCEKCGRHGPLTVDHKLPCSIRVDHSLRNLWALCRRCHNHKSALEGNAAARQNRNGGKISAGDPQFEAHSQW